MTKLPVDVEHYLRELRLGLAPLGGPDRDEVVAEVRSHFEDRLAQGRAPLLEGFLPAESYAASFLAERRLVLALATGTPWALSRSLCFGWGARALSLVVAIPLALIQLITATLVVLGALKPFVFEHVGLWLLPNGHYFLGALLDPPGREVLGWWTVPVFVIGGGSIFVLAQRGQTALARRRLRQLRSASAPP